MATAKKYKVACSVLVMPDGDPKFKGAIIDEGDIPDFERQKRIGAVVEATADEIKADNEARKKAEAEEAAAAGVVPDPSITTGDTSSVDNPKPADKKK